ncbi:alpha/beta fold hydrolase [Psychromicrobium lacuslunae]|uniref:AB hydrolase-1 domain-containing protein n=1 Tax=Psychromicrobium lacuslunae TaxID=1618207 RepID=A0A0D4BW60_9MICC|nr:alpha/beta hydrolase [Psychromicrobium lacuslunae]AJT40538.1 hypothetical protein UM93_01450 [Psychromicrobium lacuslunae]
MSEPATANIGVQFKHRGLGYFTNLVGANNYFSAYQDGLEQLPEPTAHWDIVTDFGTVRVYRFGTDGRTPLVLLPGRQAATPLWRANLPTLMALRTVYTIDLLGEPGYSVQQRPITTDAEQASWLDQVLKALELPKVHLLGLSIGGWTAINYGLHYPDRIASMTLLDPAMSFAPVSLKMILVSLGSVFPWLPQSLRHRLLSWMSGGARSSDELPEGRLISLGMSEFTLRLPTPRPFSEQQLRALDVPVLAVIAGRSIIQNPQRALQTANTTLPQGTVEFWPEASHALNGEYPELIARQTAQLIARVDSA